MHNVLSTTTMREDSKAIFRFRNRGIDHTMEDPGCSGCSAIGEAEHWPRPHRDFPGSRCLGLVHSEKFIDPVSRMVHVIVWCDTCGANPKKF
jgi:hypothetical protein